MTLYAVDDIGDAVDATRDFLLPFDRGRWLRLAIVVFFVGGGGGGVGQVGNAVPSNTGTGAPAPPTTVGSLGSTELAIVVGVVAVVVAIALGFAFVGAVMEFVFVESLRRETVRIRDDWRAHWRRGGRLFGFRLLLGVVTLVLLATVVGVAVAPLLLGVPAGILLLLIAVPVALVVAVVASLADGFTTTFVVPTMLLDERGVLAAWRRFWPVLREQWKQYVAYAVVAVVLRIGAGLLATAATLLGGLVLAIPLGLLGLLGFALTEAVAPVGWVVVGLAAVLFVLGLLLISLLVAVPIQTALRYYGLLVLGDTDASLDAIPDQRRAVRE